VHWPARLEEGELTSTRNWRWLARWLARWPARGIGQLGLEEGEMTSAGLGKGN
jgi:hypothetical protein